jgi:hypothetical protein
MILYSEGGNKMQESEADQVLAILCAAYPGHPWAVRVDQGVIFIRHLQFGSNWGMNVKFRNINHDAAVLKREIIRMAGEWLERAGLVRGRENGDEIVRVEGVPDRFQPNQPLENMDVVVNASTEPLRTEVRPQVIKGVSDG